MKPRMKRLKTYEQFLRDNPTWFEDEFPQFERFDMATFKYIVELWYKYRFLCCYDEEKFKVFFKRRILEVLPKWAEMIDLEAMRPLKADWDNLSLYNQSDYILESNTDRTDTTDTKNTGTVQKQGTGSTTMGQTMTTDGNNNGTKQNTGTQLTERDVSREDTTGGTITTKDTGTQITDTEYTGNQRTEYGSTVKTEDSSNGDSRSLGTTLPQSITSARATFEAHFEGESDSLRLGGHEHIDEEGHYYYDNPQAAWHTASTKGETKTSGSGISETQNGGEDILIRGLEDLSTRTDDLTRVQENDTTLNSDTNENTTRTDDLQEVTSGTNHSVTAYGGTNTRADSETTTNNLDTLTNGTGNSKTNTEYTTGGRTNHNPSEIILTALQNLTKFCSTDWLYLKLQPCFLLLADDFDDDIEWIPDEEWTPEDIGGLWWRI